ncbi:spermatogenesis-associated protein 24-like [Actinia tenebrosa]|uniref:Spermatogenesis-associated protein 24-like n=1 Tax=Actinia tenebrosa TaxID=6105 RepID=A0A6P8HY23_ACTTE|nr:spermatogenesis-associated protein 24-like [Actinia tenebrosa]
MAAEKVPSYMIVNKQLQDLVRIQDNILAKSIAMNDSRKENVVPLEEYEKVVRQFENEQLEHIKTKAKLASVSEKLEFALGEIDILTKQLNREKMAFEKSFGNLKHIANEESQAKNELLNKCGEMEMICSKQDDVLSSKDAQIKDLKQRLAKQKQNHKQCLSEMEIQRQQERYIIMNTHKTKDSSNNTRQRRVTFR